MKTLYQQSEFPIFQNRMYESEEEARNCPRGEIQLVECLETGLVFNTMFRPEFMVYDKNYQNEQAISPYFQRHLDDVASLIIKTMGRNRLVEVGCGKGYFLELLIAREADITGFDPTYEGDNPRIKRDYFSPSIIGRAEGLILRHVLEHIQNPVDFLESLLRANGGGNVYIEVPCFDWICAHRAWFDIFYEHVNYFRISDFYRIFDNILCSGHIFGGQYLYVIADLASLRKPKLDISDRPRFPDDFCHAISKPNAINFANASVWGGASKGVIFSLLRERAGSPVGQVIDINPAKQGKYLPGTGLRVNSPSEALENLPDKSVIYVMNSNYLEEIRLMTNNRFVYVGIDSD